MDGILIRFIPVTCVKKVIPDVGKGSVGGVMKKTRHLFYKGYLGLMKEGINTYAVIVPRKRGNRAVINHGASLIYFF
jgi:hypothetical protein